MEKNRILEIRISGYNHTGEGVGRFGQKVVFIPGAVRGERVSFELTEDKKRYARGRLLSVVEQAGGRSNPFCPQASGCGGCQLLHLAYSEQLWLKREQVQAAIERIGGLTEVKAQEVLGMEYPWHYRYTARFHVRREKGEVKIGYLTSHSHDFVEVGRCPLLPEQFYPLLDKMRDMLERIAGDGPFPVEQLVLRQGYTSSERLIVLICLCEPEIDGETMAATIRSDPGCVGMAALITDGKSPGQTSGKRRAGFRHRQRPFKETVLFDQSMITEIIGEKVLYGRDYYLDQIAGTNYQIPAEAFFQNNPRQAEKMVHLVRSLLPHPGILLDLYCGVGLFSLALAPEAKKVYGVEGNPVATAAARANACLNKLGNTNFYQGDVEKVLSGISFHPDTVILDPPRGGSTPPVLDQIARLSPNRIVYISCNPSTLARDLRQLNEKGYRVNLVQPVDMFPWTRHVECVIMMTNSGFKGK